MYSLQQGVLILAQQESRQFFISNDGTHGIYLFLILRTAKFKQRDFLIKFKIVTLANFQILKNKYVTLYQIMPKYLTFYCGNGTARRTPLKGNIRKEHTFLFLYSYILGWSGGLPVDPVQNFNLHFSTLSRKRRH